MTMVFSQGCRVRSSFGAKFMIGFRAKVNTTYSDLALVGGAVWLRIYSALGPECFLLGGGLYRRRLSYLACNKLEIQGG